jgi:hypothetical protein
VVPGILNAHVRQVNLNLVKSSQYGFGPDGRLDYRPSLESPLWLVGF